MYLIEKIGELVLITLEGNVKDEEIQAIKTEIKNLTKVEDDDEEGVVISLNRANLDGSIKDTKLESRYQEIIDFCVEANIRVYSYMY
ncbi:MAG: hypothetical protein GTO45_23475 [Candidatus Aminicenantes bacterium]|nr:hypothetical protein [Candidatus Aminicenantes bacterium]NIM81719.1 hypothetical protein [Candidatus Aminicenantes bacterium]NIN21090.1 hypothetical protein [Candidatus Aminicenantes bacterium]NIN44912.1 hypothetical protein [Candidatus Aminicenantes bacterium]NIN87726.1 hypothetical protein [Candidatus Aminicenantes bacterium]